MPHALIALAVQAALWIPFGPWLGAVAASLMFFMREVTQAEYRWIEAHGGVRGPMPWWMGADVRLWDWHSISGVLYPMAAVFAVAALSAI